MTNITEQAVDLHQTPQADPVTGKSNKTGIFQ